MTPDDNGAHMAAQDDDDIGSSIFGLTVPRRNRAVEHVNDKDSFILNIVENFPVAAPYVVPPGMPLSIWEDKYSRRLPEGGFQSWEQRLREVIAGNFSLDSRPVHSIPGLRSDLEDATRLAVQGLMMFSGRHLQHGDMDQRKKNMELFTNCSTAVFNFTLFWLLLNGSGVGSDYSCFTRRINYCKHMPHVRLVLDGGSFDDGQVSNGAHRDYASAFNEFGGFFESKREATHKYPANSEDVRWFTVEDSREGWVKVIEILETAAWQEKHSDKMFVFDFSGVRPSGDPIKGQQGRPASGPLPLMRALSKVANMKGIPSMAPWKQSMFIDHYLAACVALGGVRRAARMATKYWKDPDVFDFIEIKRGGHLWSANISVVVDDEFWRDTKDPRSHAWRVFQAVSAAQYYDQTGEPGFVNVGKMNTNLKGVDQINGENYINPDSKLQIHPRTREMMGKILGYIKTMRAPMPYIVNPCGEIPLALWGAYCVIGDICLARATSLDDVKRAGELMAQALIRVNTMPNLYHAEVNRTNRIGVAITGIHEFAAKFFGLNWYDMVNSYNTVSKTNEGPEHHLFIRSNAMDGKRREKAQEFWNFISDLRRSVETEANRYSISIGSACPHTYTTIKPSGTISKVAGCTEGAHLPAVSHYMRWVQQIKEIGGVANPKITEHEALGYPIKDISHQYQNAVVIGFPTKQPIADILGDNVVTAEEATPAEQFEWLRLIEQYWFGQLADGSPANGQVSYTMKYNPEKVPYNEYMKMLRQEQSTVRCCSVMPIVDASAYAYQPEEKITREEYEAAIARITQVVANEEYDDDALNCAGGVCAVDLSINRRSSASA